MILLWAVFAVMALLGAAFLILPILRYQPKADVSGELVNSLVYRDRLKELDGELEGDAISQEQYEQLKQELELTLLSDVQASQPDQGGRTIAGKWMVWVLLALVPLAGFFIYVAEGQQAEVSHWFEQQRKLEKVLPQMMSGNFEEAEKAGVGVDDFIRSLQKHLQSNSDDDQGWYLLGSSYLQMRMPQQSELAFRRAMDLQPDNIDYLMGFTQASLALNNGQLTPTLMQNLRHAIQRQPNNPKPYMTWGMALFQQRDYQAAITIWQQYLDRPDADPQAAQLLQRSIQVAQQGMGRSAAVSTPASPPTSAPTPTQSADAPSIAVTVNVAESVQAQLKPSDVLFVYAKATSGPPMPLAVVRQPVSGWPVSAVLDDNNAMTPAMTLSKFQEVVVQARISPTGNAIPQSGDWIGPSTVIQVKPGQQSVALQINAKMP